MPDTISTHLAVALVLGAFVLGYLLAEWYFDGILRKVDVQLADDSHHITHLVDCNDVLSTENEELRSKIREHDAIFGPNAVDTYRAKCERVTQLEALLQLQPDRG